MRSTFTQLASIATALVVSLSSTTAQSVVSITSDKDATLYESTNGSLANGAGRGMFVGKVGFNGGYKKRRAIVHWDIAGAIPAGSRILAVSLDMWSEQSAAFLPVDTDVHRVLANWTEGSTIAAGNGGMGGPSSNGSVTWIHRSYPNQFWNSAGGDFAATPTFTFPMPGIGAVQTPSNDAIVADVQDMLDNPANNFGWLFKKGEVLNSTANRLNTREAPALLPKIVVTYLAPGQTGTYGTGWPVGTGTFQLDISGTASGGSVLPITYSNAPSPSIGVNFFSLDINLTGTPLLPASLLYLPLSGVLIPGATILTAGGVSGSTFTVPSGFPGYLIVVQAAVLDNNALSFSMSNAGVMLTQ